MKDIHSKSLNLLEKTRVYNLSPPPGDLLMGCVFLANNKNEHLLSVYSLPATALSVLYASTHSNLQQSYAISTYSYLAYFIKEQTEFFAQR